jgi:NADH-quinone oxidoreductase subunit M
MLTLAIFTPLIAAAVAMLVPGHLRAVTKVICLLGALVTLGVASVVTWDYYQGGGRLLSDLVQERTAAALSAPENARVAPLMRELLARERTTDDERSQLEAQGKLALFEHLLELKLAQAAAGGREIRYVELASWIPAIRVNYFVGIDGLAVPIFWLTALLGVICIIYSWSIEKQTKGYFVLFMLLETGLLGVFASLDFFLFYVFWEVVLLPMYFLIGIWGGPRRIYASIKFFIYTLVGSVLMLLAMLAMYYRAQPHTFNILALQELIPRESIDFQRWIFFALFIGFAIKVPVFPFHTWLPDAHVEAPTAVSVVLAGILLKMGGYGFFRFNYPITPAAATEPWIVKLLVILGLINMVYGALVAMAQRDFKALVAYSSISHMGYVLLGMASLTATGVNGAVFQMFTHGISSAMLFLLVGVIYDRAHHRVISDFGGLGLQMPVYTGLAIVGFFTSLGLPGLAGFWSEVMVFLGAWNTSQFAKLYVYIGVLTVVLTAAYILWTIQRVYLGTLKEKYAAFRDVSAREITSLVPLAALCIIVGVLPHLVLNLQNPAVGAMLSAVKGR